MKVNQKKIKYRVKVLAIMFVFVLLTLFIFGDILDLVNEFSLQNEEIKVSGFMNDGSTFAMFAITTIIVIASLIGFIVGMPFNWITKNIGTFLVGLTMVAFFIGVFVNVSLKQKLENNGYVECVSERELSSKYSSRTYVKSIDACQKME